MPCNGAGPKGLRCSAEATGQLKPSGNGRSPWTKQSRSMATAEHREPYESRGSRTVLGAPGGESPPGDSTEADIRQRDWDVRIVPGPEVAPVGRYLPWRACSVDCFLKSLRVVTVIAFAIEALLQRLHDCAAAGQAAFVNMQTRVPRSGTNECLGTLRVDTFCAHDDDAA